MKKLSSAVLLMLIAACIAFAQEVITSGKAIIKKAPEVATLDLEIEGRAPTADGAQAKTAKTLSQIQSKLAKLSKVSMSTTKYTLVENIEHSSGKAVKNGYKATILLELRIDDLSVLTRALALAETEGVSKLEDLTFDVRDRKTVELQALKEAVHDALRKAEAMAAAVGKTGVELLRLQEEEVSFSDPFSLQIVNPVLMRGSAMAMMPDRPEPYVVPATIEIEASVVALYKLR